MYVLPYLKSLENSGEGISGYVEETTLYQIFSTETFCYNNTVLEPNARALVRDAVVLLLS